MVKRLTHSAGAAGGLEPIIRLWLLRLLVPLGGHRDFVRAHGFNNDAVAEAVGLGFWVDSSQHELPRFLRRGGASAPAPDHDFDAKQVLADLRALHRQAEQAAPAPQVPACLQRNVGRLGDLVGLSATDGHILAFAVCLHNERLLDDAADWLGQLSSVKVFQSLAGVLGLPEAEVRAALSPQGLLARSGLVCVDRSGTSSLRGKLNLLSDVFADMMSTAEAEPISLLRGTVSAVAPGQLALSDYAHIQPMLDIVLPYLRHSQASGRRGVNIFLHGAPGTGKSQLARALAQALGSELFEVASEDGDGDPVHGERRLRAFGAAQSFFAQRQALVVFDEVEDVFNDGDGLFGRKSTAQVRKAWVNRMLEENPVPSFWLSNSVRGLDPAFIRRFDMVFELPVPPQHQRQRILQQHCGELLNAGQLARIAEAEALAPAVVAKASAVVRAIAPVLGATQAAEAFASLVSNTLEAQGHGRLLPNDPSRLPEVYDPAFLNADTDLSAVAAGLRQAGAGRLCLYGPPGTGKTAYGRWLAQQLGRPLRVKRASDLLSKWLGETEQQLAQAFRQAQASGEVLMLDEVDSFLQDRRQAERSWEHSLVNEMLTQMEAFAGVFIASTNRMDGLDPAALRRFDLKVGFAPLRPEQAWALLGRHCHSLGLAPPPAGLRAKLRGLAGLTPGDFAAVARQHRFLPRADAAGLVQALAAECALKAGPASRLGFL